ncbi:hypothetical protein PROFUN_02742 [Planoprotostelium fungivorum]|uniref:Uncharacterized protein n=1 Tax=Planoprotostelium fungivorum TaxID=1890364 RepID=A0A2P6NXI5_9EUKA|nr:hypothetical protein PROFUN_02742 [Planoprotostelium fungivorum]
MSSAPARNPEPPKGDHVDLVGDYHYAKGSSGIEKYTQDVSLRADGTASYSEYNETRTESFTRSGDGSWKVEEDLIWVYCRELKKVTKAKKTVPIPGFGDETKVDLNVAVEMKLQQVRTAPPAGPTAPKNRWTKK